MPGRHFLPVDIAVVLARGLHEFVLLQLWRLRERRAR